MFEEQAFGIGLLYDAVSGTAKHVGYTERYSVGCLFRFVKPVDVKQVVHKLEYMLAVSCDVLELVITFLLVACLHRQFRAAVYSVKGSAYVMGDGQDDLVTHFKQFRILTVAFFQFAAYTFFACVVTHDDEV